MYYFLLLATPLDLTQIREVFIRSGRGKSIAYVEKILSDAGLNLGKIIEHKMLKRRKKLG